jgi:hypothetical protein
LTGHSTIRENNASCNARAASANPPPPPPPPSALGTGRQEHNGHGGGQLGTQETVGAPAAREKGACPCHELPRVLASRGELAPKVEAGLKKGFEV